MSTTETPPDRRMYRYIVPVDDESHLFTLTHDPVAVASDERTVEFWAENDPRCGASDRAFRVFGTGQSLPDDARWVGTCPRTRLGLVWHLYELVSDEEPAS